MLQVLSTIYRIYYLLHRVFDCLRAARHQRSITFD